MRFLAVEHRLPSREVTNDEVVAKVRAGSAKNLSPAELDVLEQMTWECFKSAGTQVRYHRAAGENAVDLAVDAGRRALDTAGLDPLDIDLVIYVGIGRGVLEPASANIYQDMLGLRNATAFDVLDACASWLRALHLAQLFLAGGVYRNILLVNAEFAGRDVYRYELKSIDEFAHWHPSVTIGEAATATIVSGPTEPQELRMDFRTWGDKRDLCFVPLPNFDGYFGKSTRLATDPAPLQFVSFGMRLMEFGTRMMIEHYRDSPQFREFEPDVVFGHSASDGMSEYVLDACGIDRAKFRPGHCRHANTVSASVPLSMSEALENGTLSDGDRVLLMVASAGVTTGLSTFVFRNR